ncbi:MAG TPA: hypothetical protein VFJ68_08855 [Casimicrobiaceae bacterium]|nr:hypothetical protein [Casimicrobiaceae bacterium]
MEAPESARAEGAGRSAIAHTLRRIAQQHAERLADPGLARALERLARWQSARLGQTYEDLARRARYGDAIRFFRTDLYGGADFAQRDADLARAAPSMARILPERLVASLAQALELNALSQALDRSLLAHLPSRDHPFTVAQYCAAYRAMGSRRERGRQLELIHAFGVALDAHVRKPLVYAALVAMRRPARAAGFAVLQSFLERGFAAFKKMGGAKTFLETIDERERRLMEAIFGGGDAPFAEPLVESRRPAARLATRG